MEHIRNFSIIAHIDHGKSTLADRLLEITGTVPRDKLREQFLDSMDLEREHGVTIKAHPVRMEYRGYVLNLLDTPGHVDFSYEVSRSIASCEGAVLLVDATQGVEAQTVTHYELAKEHGLVIIPVINKIDLPNADFENVAEEIIELTGCDLEDIILISAKEGIGIEELLDAVIERIPPPRGEPDAPLRALIFDSIYDDYRGAVPYVRIFDGEIRPGMKIKLFSTGREYEVMEVGHFRPQRVRADALKTGEVGWVSAGIKSIRDTRVGDTITDAKNPAERPLPGYREVKPMVFSGIYPSRGEDFEALGKALEKLKLNDASLTFQIEQSALGFGYRCGFLGLFHTEIVEERIEREYNIPIIATTPNVRYRVKTKKGEVFEIENPAMFPPMGDIESIEEPIVRGEIIS
ncbi:elongation factor 4, partial [bacterium]